MHNYNSDVDFSDIPVVQWVMAIIVACCFKASVRAPSTSDFSLSASNTSTSLVASFLSGVFSRISHNISDRFLGSFHNMKALLAQMIELYLVF